MRQEREKIRQERRA
jgi:hypothetical protein